MLFVARRSPPPANGEARKRSARAACAGAERSGQSQRDPFPSRPGLSGAAASRRAARIGSEIYDGRSRRARVRDAEPNDPALRAAGLPAASEETAALPIPAAARPGLAPALRCLARAFGAYATAVALDARAATLSLRAPASSDRSLRPALLHDPDFVRAFPLYVLGALHGFAVRIDCGPYASEATLRWALDGARTLGDRQPPDAEIEEAFWTCAAQLWQDGTADADPTGARATQVAAPDRLQ